MKSKILQNLYTLLQYGLLAIILQCFHVDLLEAAHLDQSTLKDIVISGTVTAENGEPLPGVNILIKGSVTGTVTDVTGAYSLEVPEGSALIFSFIGYETQEILIGTNSKINISMVEDISALEEIIVVGYGTQKKKEVTNAVVQLKGSEISKTPAISLTNALAGQMAGLFVIQTSSVPGLDDASINVRGSNTFGNNSALIVIDGVANRDPAGFSRLDPNDIESITVLKDASAAIYGAQSAGGVILVTTKRGKVGAPKLNYSFTQGWNSPTSKPKVATAIPYMNVINSADELDGRDPTFPDDIINQYETGQRVSEDWWEALLGGQTASQSRHSLSLSGGSEKIRYYTSLGYTREGALMVTDEKTRNRQYNVRTNIDIQASDDLEIGLDLAFRRKSTQTPQNGGGGLDNFAVTTSPLKEAFIDGNINWPTEGWAHLNPAARATGPGYARFNNSVFNGTLRYKYDVPVVEGLSLEGFAAFDRWDNYNKLFSFTWHYYEKDSQGEVVRRLSREVEPVGLTEEFNQRESITVNVRLNYKKIFSEVHSLSAFVAYEQNEADSLYFWTQRLGYESSQIDQLFAGSPDRANFNNSGGASEGSRQNFFGRVSYDYKSKLLFQFNWRYDGSPIFPEGERFGFFPGASIGWRLSEEAFTPDLFSDLKLRFSWGRLGNDRVRPFQYLGSYGFGGGYVVNGSDVTGLVPITTPNPNITWEESENFDLGIEAGFLEGRLNFELDLFKMKTTNILAQRIASIPEYTGLSLPDENIGEMENKGVELQISYAKRTSGGFNFNVRGNLSYAENKIIFFDETPLAGEYQKLEGKPFGSSLVYNAIGIYRTAADLAENVSYTNAGLGELIFADLNDDGVINGDDRYRYDNNTLPKIQYGLNLGANYKNFDLNILFQGAAKSKKRLNNRFDGSSGGNGLRYVADNTYTLDNTDAILPRVLTTTLGGDDSDFWYHNANYLRLKSLELGYTLPEQIISRVGISNLRFYVGGYNLLTFDSMGDLAFGDPESINGLGGGYPLMKTVSLGLNVTF